MSRTSDAAIDYDNAHPGAYWCGRCRKLILPTSDLCDGEWHTTCGKQVEWLEYELEPTPPSPETADLRNKIRVIADEASSHLATLNLGATPSWLLKLYGLSVDGERREARKPWGLRDRQA